MWVSEPSTMLSNEEFHESDFRDIENGDYKCNDLDFGFSFNQDMEYQWKYFYMGSQQQK